MEKININLNKKIVDVSPMLYGIFFEDINFSGDGGLYAQLLTNNSFEYFDIEKKIDKRLLGWECINNAVLKVSDELPLNDINTNYVNIVGGSGGGIKNLGFNNIGFSVKKDEKYKFSFYARSKKNTRVVISIVSDDIVFAKAEIEINNCGWTKYEKCLFVDGTYENAQFDIVLLDGGDVDIDFVSLFPNTFNDRENGMRIDLVQMLKELNPKFMRFPGGCIVEGRSFENMYRWKDTIGDVEKRKINWNRWQLPEYQLPNQSSDDYFQSYGIGYYEYFLLCEDLGAKPVPIMNVGMTCQWHEALLVDVDKLDEWIQDVFDLIEFANGDENSEWGQVRIELGHKEPFNLEYIGIGNEQWGKVYFDRYEMFYKELSEKYPEIKLITSAGWTSDGDDFDYAMDWVEQNRDKAFAIDEHYYKSPKWFMENINRYDNYDRSLPKVFAGEYACHTDKETPKRRNNWNAAICEAAFLTGIEKNADHVWMTCYAPLFAKTGFNQWQPNLIWFNNESVYGTPSYYVQQLFARNIGNTIVESSSGDKEVYTSVSADEKNIFIKIVNTADTDKLLQINLVDCNVNRNAHITSITARPDDENSHENPTNVYPVEKMIEFSNSGSINILKNSVYVLKLEKQTL